jgi:hypothetical protein
MTNKVRKPRWGALYALFALLVGLIGLVEATVAPGAARRTLEMVVTLMLFGLMALWVRVNRLAVDAEGERETPVVPPAPPLRTDAELVAELKTRLRLQAQEPEGDLLIDARNGVLWLSGPVESTARKLAIETMARSVPGCRDLRSYLFERSPARASDILSASSARRR